MAKYIINNNTKEIHRSAYVVSNCRINEISWSHREDTDDDWRVAQLIKAGYNGCYWCYRSQDKG